MKYKQSRAKRILIFVGPLLLLFSLIFLLNQPEPAAVGSPDVRTARPQPIPDTSSSDFREAYSRYRRDASGSPVASALIELAAKRRAQMLGWMAGDPERALAEAVSRSEYEALPEELKPFFEKPFNRVANLRVLPVCNANFSADPVRLLEMDGSTWDAVTYGSKSGNSTKENSPLAGITLDGRAVIRELPLERIDSAELGTISGLPIANPDPGRDFLTGEPIGKDPVVALAGGQRFLFASSAGLDELNSQLVTYDASPGPNGGASVLFDPAAKDANGDFSLSLASDLVTAEADSWTENPKNVFFIRVDFSDIPGEVVSQSSLANILNTSVSDSIGEMSYGKTKIIATVSSTTVRMPSPSSTYLPSNNDALYNDAKAAYLALAGGLALNGYDIVGVHFPGIGISSGGLTYAGLAGGSRQWLQGTTSTGVIIHEFGHNYGIGHSSFWDTSGASVIGAGTSIEYGDPYDIMGSGPDPEGHFHMQAKQKLNWLGSGQWADATASGNGTYRIYRFDDPATTGAIRGLRVTRSPSPAEYFWIGQRSGIPGNAALKNGAYIVWQQPGQTRSWLLDLTPGSAGGKNDAALSLGTTWTEGNINITPTATGGAGADTWIDVNVRVGPFPGNTAPVIGGSIPATAEARKPVNFSISATDPQSDPLAYSWNFGDGVPSTNSPTPSHTWTVGGTYQVTVTVSDMKGGTATLSQSVVVSDPLATWTSATFKASTSATAIGFFRGLHVVGSSSSIHTSANGVNWSESKFSDSFTPRAFLTTGTRCISVGGGSNPGIHVSDDGRIWRKVAASTADLQDAAAGGGAIVAVGNSGLILRSVDQGETWSATNIAGGPNLTSVSYGSGVFAAVGGTTLLTSPDGLNWIDRSAATGIADWHSLRSIAWHNGAFHAGGWYSGIRVSNDGGVSWHGATIAGGASYEVRRIVSAGSFLVAVADRKTAPNNRVLLVSLDGEDWREGGPGPLDAGLEKLSYGGSRIFAAFGSAGAFQISASLAPPNAAPAGSISAPAAGSARTPVLFSSSATDSDGDVVSPIWDFKDGGAYEFGTSASHRFLTGGSYSVDLYLVDSRGGVTKVSHAISITDPLDTWSTPTSGTTAKLNDIATDGAGQLVAVGESSGTYRVSTDGNTWTGGTIALNHYLYGICYGGGKYVAVGQDYDFSISNWVGIIYTSTNGTTWTQRRRQGGVLRKVATGNGTFVAVGDGGLILSSPDGITWTPRTSGITRVLNGVAFGGGVFVAAGYQNSVPGVILTSPDGTSWTDTSSGTNFGNSQGFYDVDWCNDRFLGSGWYGRLRHSTDGGASFSSKLTDYHRIAGMAYGNGVYLAAGINQSNADADIDLISTDGQNWLPLGPLSVPDRRAAIFYGNSFITVGDSGSIRRSSAFSAPPAAGFWEWKQSIFPGDPPLSGPKDDFDFDGFPNLAEYAMGSDARSFASPPPSQPIRNGGMLEMYVPKNPSANGVTRVAESSGDLIIWVSGGVTITGETANGFTMSIPVSSAPPGKGFMRVSYALDP